MVVDGTGSSAQVVKRHDKKIIETFLTFANKEFAVRERFEKWSCVMVPRDS